MLLILIREEQGLDGESIMESAEGLYMWLDEEVLSLGELCMSHRCFHPWKHSRPGWTGLWATWSS